MARWWASPLVRPILFASLVLLALALNLWHAGDVSIWYDEGWTYGLSSQHLHVMRRYIWGPFQNMALYYLFMHYWLQLLATLHIHPVEWLFRLPSVISAALSVGIVYLLGRRYFNTIAAIVGSALYAMSGLILYAAHQARSYGMEMLFVCAAWYALFAALTSGTARARRWWWAIYSATMVLEIYTHLYGFLVLAAQMSGLALLLALPGPWRHRARSSWLPIAMSLAAIAILVTPMVIDVKRFGGEAKWIPVPTPSDAQNFVLLLTHGTTNGVLAILSLGFCALAAVAATFASLRRSRWGDAVQLPAVWGERTSNLLERPRTGVLLLVCWLCVPFLLAYFASQPALNAHLFYPRYLVVIAPPFALLIGIAVSIWRSRIVQLALGVLLVGLTLTTLPDWYATNQIQDFRTPAFWLERQYRAGDGLTCAPVQFCSVPFEYYLEAYPGPAHFDGDSPGWWNWEYYFAPTYNLDAFKQYATAHHRVFLLTLRQGPGVTPQSEAVADLGWLQAHAHLVSKEETASWAIYLFDTTPAAT